jgi:hypothetical protein
MAAMQCDAIYSCREERREARRVVGVGVGIDIGVGEMRLQES